MLPILASYCCISSEAAGAGPSLWVPTIHTGDLHCNCVSRSQPGVGPTLVAAGIWRVNQHKGIFFSMSVCLSTLSDPQINEKLKRQTQKLVYHGIPSKTQTLAMPISAVEGKGWESVSPSVVPSLVPTPVEEFAQPSVS